MKLLAAGVLSPMTIKQRQPLVVRYVTGNILGGEARDHDHAGEQVGMGERIIPGHVAPRELAGGKDAVTVDRIALAGIAQRQLDGGMFAGCIVIIRAAGPARNTPVRSKYTHGEPPGLPGLDRLVRTVALCNTTIAG